MTLILRDDYTHRVAIGDPYNGTLSTDCGMPISRLDPVRTFADREAARLVDCPGCIRARLDQLDEVAE